MTQGNILNPPKKRAFVAEAKREFTPVYAGYVDHGRPAHADAFSDDELVLVVTRLALEFCCLDCLS